jgi:hypothetical protein
MPNADASIRSVESALIARIEEIVVSATADVSPALSLATRFVFPLVLSFASATFCFVTTSSLAAGGYDEMRSCLGQTSMRCTCSSDHHTQTSLREPFGIVTFCPLSALGEMESGQDP